MNRLFDPEISFIAYILELTAWFASITSSPIVVSHNYKNNFVIIVVLQHLKRGFTRSAI